MIERNIIKSQFKIFYGMKINVKLPTRSYLQEIKWKFYC